MLYLSQNAEHELFVISTPIGNLKDITIRAINILQELDYIICENINNSKILFNEYNIINKN